MAENFEAQTGDGLCDPTFAWASAAYLWLPAPQFSSQSG